MASVAIPLLLAFIMKTSSQKDDIVGHNWLFAELYIYIYAFLLVFYQNNWITGLHDAT